MSMSQFEAFLACELNPLVAPIHPKAMPVILHLDDYDRWLAGDSDKLTVEDDDKRQQSIDL